MIPRMGSDREKPQSATHGAVAAVGVSTFLATIAAIRYFQPFGHDVVASAIAIIGATTAAIFLVDLTWQKVHLRPSTGLDLAKDDPSWSRTLTKLAGLAASVGVVGLGYWLFPEYHRAFFDDYFKFLGILVIPWIVLVVPYFFWVDRRMCDPRDGYWHLGRLVVFRWEHVDRSAVGQHLLGWVIKGYFTALMFTYTCADVKSLFLFDFATLTAPKALYGFLSHFLYFVDAGIASMGYIMSFRLTDTHIRSAEPTTLGWLVAIICYEPFYAMLTRLYLPYATGYSWDAWLVNRPMLYAIWAAALLVLVGIFVWSTVIFGARFSNLTHRGIITNGPYRWTKHPAYLTKSIFFWMTALPFMPRGTLDETIGRCLLLLAVNFIYIMRAKTEEWHLSRDPVYVQYALWIDEHGLFRTLKHLPLLRYLAFRPPPQPAGSVSAVRDPLR